VAGGVLLDLGDTLLDSRGDRAGVGVSRDGAEHCVAHDHRGRDRVEDDDRLAPPGPADPLDRGRLIIGEPADPVAQEAAGRTALNSE